eukprot:gene8364-207_t
MAIRVVRDQDFVGLPEVAESIRSGKIDADVLRLREYYEFHKGGKDGRTGQKRKRETGQLTFNKATVAPERELAEERRKRGEEKRRRKDAENDFAKKCDELHQECGNWEQKHDAEQKQRIKAEQTAAKLREELLRERTAKEKLLRTVGKLTDRLLSRGKEKKAKKEKKKGKKG